MSGISLSKHFVLQIIDTQRVNLPQDFSYVMMNLPVLVLSLTLNTWAVVVILGKERSRLNMFLVFTCLVKIVFMSVSTLGPLGLPQPALPASVRHDKIACVLEALVLLSLGLVDRSVSLFVNDIAVTNSTNNLNLSKFNMVLLTYKYGVLIINCFNVQACLLQA